ncbi:Carbohydrate-binding X8 domain superfamily protein [Zea mays]|nr:Carbohydrate-binding X8 domain superfamily protein [Zea mays]
MPRAPLLDDEFSTHPSLTTPNSPPQVGPGTPFGSVPPSPIIVVSSPPGSGPDPGSGSGGGGSGSGGGPFQPPIIYPPPLAPPLAPGAGQTLWCVAKPTVPDPIIQEAIYYACGAGAGCDSILPSGSCYRPNTVLAHASFAFNSYWQQAKATDGTCDFGDTATIVTRDPSYEECKFDLL